MIGNDITASLVHRDMLTIGEAAVWFGVSRGWFFDRIERRAIPYYGQRRCYRVSKQEIENYLRSDRTPSDYEVRALARKHIITKHI